MSIGFVHRDRCPVCAHESYQRLCNIAFGDERMREYLADLYRGRLPLNLLQSERYSVVSCDRCGFVYQDRILDGEGMQALYEHWIDQEASLAKKQKVSEQLYRKYAAQVQTLIKMIGAPPDRIRALDFGMGWGCWSLIARDHGLQVTGFELSERRRRHAQSSGLDVINELPPPGNHYDVVYANQVFEQGFRALVDPVAIIDVKNHGLLVVPRKYDGAQCFPCAVSHQP